MKLFAVSCHMSLQFVVLQPRCQEDKMTILEHLPLLDEMGYKSNPWMCGKASG